MLRAATHLGHPPAKPNEEEAPIVEELRRLPFHIVADELERPPDDEHLKRERPEAVHEAGDDEEREGCRDERNTAVRDAAQWRITDT